MLTELELALCSLCFLVNCNLRIGRFVGKSKREKQKGTPSQKMLKLQCASKGDETVPSKTYFERHAFTLPETKLWKQNELGCPSPPSVGSFIPLIRSPVAVNAIKAMKAVWTIFLLVAYVRPLRKTSRSDWNIWFSLFLSSFSEFPSH